ncbi:uncharacterized protein LOC133932997 isoform X7 [Platichthys flesus]|uniref:uncharacterized protein LOC133932997 isoform X7 n=1 Tax=Platichthys flesus TaxID=8260 RepID=UPI002DB6622B|nr:uncharacterized protein LOC133932997 isoform X7 [Platichthys flesus]
MLRVVPAAASILYSTDVQSWRSCVGDAVWLRDQVVAPVTEELVFRWGHAAHTGALCRTHGAIFIAPLFSGVAYLHHVIEQRRLHKESMSVILLVAGQSTYNPPLKDHPIVIKRCCASVLLVAALSPVAVKAWTHRAEIRLALSALCSDRGRVAERRVARPAVSPPAGHW